MGLDYSIDGDLEIIERLNRALLTQLTVSAEVEAAKQSAISSAQPQPNQPDVAGRIPGPEPGIPLGPSGQGAPESINPLTNPVGAAGGNLMGVSQ